MWKKNCQNCLVDNTKCILCKDKYCFDTNKDSSTYGKCIIVEVCQTCEEGTTDECKVCKKPLPRSRFFWSIRNKELFTKTLIYSTYNIKNIYSSSSIKSILSKNRKNFNILQNRNNFKCYNFSILNFLMMTNLFWLKVNGYWLVWQFFYLLVFFKLNICTLIMKCLDIIKRFFKFWLAVFSRFVSRWIGLTIIKTTSIGFFYSLDKVKIIS